MKSNSQIARGAPSSRWRLSRTLRFGALLTAFCFCVALFSQRTAQGGPPPLRGTAIVTPDIVDGGCVDFTPAQAGGPDNWEVAEGGKYIMTLTGVTECTDDTITVFVQSTPTGNFCFNAEKDSSGNYVGKFTMSKPACSTYPISYKCGKDQPCNNDSTFDARGPSGASKVHLRASTFDAFCHKTGDDTDCSGIQCNLTVNVDNLKVCSTKVNHVYLVATPGAAYPNPHYSWTINGQPAGTDSDSILISGAGTYQVVLTSGSCTASDSATVTVVTDCSEAGCNVDPLFAYFDCAAASTAPDLSHPPVTCNPGYNLTYSDGPRDSTKPCYSFLRTWHCENPNTGLYSECTQTIIVEDKIAPTIHATGNGGDLLCNPTEAQIEAALGTATASDNCDTSVTPIPSDSQSNVNCVYTKTRTFNATDSCGNKAVAVTVTVTWKVDTEAPTITLSPASSVACNPTPEQIETALGSATATDNCDLLVEVNHSDSTVTSAGCVYKQSRTFTAKDSCNNAATPKTREITWTVDNDAPTITCADVNVAFGSKDCSGTVAFSATASDNCGDPTITYTIQDGGTTTVITSPHKFPMNTTTEVTATATDACGHTASCTFNVKVAGCFTTYTLGGWGAKPSGNNPGTLLTNNFATLYPSGLKVGGLFTITLTSQPAVQTYLSVGAGTPGVLKQNYTNPTTKNSSGTLSLQTIALQLNVDFSAAGKLGTGAIGGLKVKPGVPYYAGKTVSEVLAIANAVLGGNLAALPGGTISDLNTVLDSINRNFDNGGNNNYLVP